MLPNNHLKCNVWKNLPMAWNFSLVRGSSWTWPYDSWIYNHLCNQCLSPLTLWVWIPLMASVLDTTLCDKVCQWLAAGQGFSPGNPVSSINKTDRHDIAEILLKVALNTINRANLKLKEKFEDIKGWSETVNWRTDNIMTNKKGQATSY